jgi:NADPH2:quinone reductase
VRDVGDVQADDRVLVLGASGGVGSLVVQLAKGAGATVWGHTGDASKVPFLEGLGVDRAVVSDAPGLQAAVAELGPTVAVDPLAGAYTAALVPAMAPFSRIVLYGASAGPSAEVDLRTLYRKSIQLLTYSGTSEPESRNREAMERALEEAARGGLRVPIDEVLPLEGAQEAHRRILERRVRGKLLLQP